MPLLAAARLNTRLSSYFYSYGKLCASKTLPFLTLSLTLVCFFSFPVVSRFLYSLNFVTIPTIPLEQLDAQFWLLSPHVHLNNISSTELPSLVTVQQIRVAIPEKIITKDLLIQSSRFENTLRTMSVQVNGKPQAFASICVLRRGKCVIHSPAIYWKDEKELQADDDWLTSVNRQRESISDTTGLSMHPLSVFGNVTLDSQGQFVSADSIVLTVLLTPQPTMEVTSGIWDALWLEVSRSLAMVRMDKVSIQGYEQQDLASAASAAAPVAYHKQTSEKPQTIQFQPKSWLKFIPGNMYLSFAAYVAVFVSVSSAFRKTNLVKSNFTFGFATVFISIACYTTTCGILDQIGIELHTVPRYLLPVISGVAAIENVFLLTNAVISAGCDMQVREKIARGLESIGVPMTATLCVEMSILAIGAKMDISFVQELCIFAQITLLVEYFLQLTFYLSVLSIDVHRAELADLDDTQMSKRLRELASCNLDADQNPDFCPIQDDADDGDAKTCAECKEFKTHRVVNALLLCLILLSSSLFRSKIEAYYSVANILERDNQRPLATISDHFWKNMHLGKDIQWLQVNPPRIVIYSNDPRRTWEPMQDFSNHYAAKAALVADQQATQEVQSDARTRRSSLLRSSISSITKYVYRLVCSINVPAILLSMVLVGIIMWLTPRWRKQWLIPFVKWNFVAIALRLMAFASSVVASYKFGFFFRQTSEYNADGVHIGAISAQQQFNEQQHKYNVKNVRIKTLSGKHISDIRQLDVNAKHSTLVSCGEDGRVVLWNTEKAQWMARLDRWYPSNLSGGVLEGDLNSDYYQNDIFKYKTRRRIRSLQIPLATARCVKIDAGNRWISAGFDNGVVRVWDTRQGFLVRELNVHAEAPLIVKQEDLIRRRRRNKTNEPTTSYTTSDRQRGTADRVVELQFVGAVAEYCHPLVAEVAARLRTANNERHSAADLEPSQNYLVSLHKSGIIREWDIISGECVQSIPSGHIRDVTLLQAVECRPPHRKLGVTWIFTASKDGIVKCWERLLDKTANDKMTARTTTWTCIYTLDTQSCATITALTTEFPVGGMGILVTGSSDGAVKVWNLESGEHVCTLSSGGIKKKITLTHTDGMLFERNMFTETLPKESTQREATLDLDHHGAISQVAVTRYCEAETGPGMCRGCDTCFGNGFFVAWSSADGLVHVWRLERSDGSHDGSCTLCSRDYHRNQYRRSRTSTTPSKTPPPVMLPRVIRRPRPSRSTTSTQQPSIAVTNNNTEWSDDLVDIEQLAGDGSAITLVPKFLGNINQLAGRGLVFCNNMILAGVRRQPDAGSENVWEAWFASLQYYEPPMTAYALNRIPVEAFSLDDIDCAPSDGISNSNASKDVQRQQILLQQQQRSSLRRSLYSVWASFFGSDKTSHQTRKNYVPLDGAKKDDDGDFADDDDEIIEANEALPFSAVRHVVGLDGVGLACEYGNFIKLIYLDDEKHFSKIQARPAMYSKPKKVSMNQPDTCACNGDKDNCCNSSLTKPSAEPVRPTMTTCTIRKQAECPSKSNCSRASDCSASFQVGSRRPPPNTYNWR